MGPAIALDVVGYVAMRRRTLAVGASLSASALVREAVEILLFPQFEGRDQAHETLVEALTTVFALGDDERAATDRTLRVWTGFKPGGEIY